LNTVLLIIHLFVTLALIGVVLIQRSEGGGLGIGSSQGMGAFMSGRGTANLLTRTTAILATIFMALSLTLALLNRGTGGAGASIFDTTPAPVSTEAPKPGAAPESSPAATSPATAPGAPTTAAPTTGAPTTGAPATGAPTTSRAPTAGGNAPPAPAPTPAAPAAPSAPTN
jgi:preprotein translocase subunit SecG